MTVQLRKDQLHDQVQKAHQSHGLVLRLLKVEEEHINRDHVNRTHLRTVKVQRAVHLQRRVAAELISVDLKRLILLRVKRKAGTNQVNQNLLGGKLDLTHATQKVDVAHINADHVLKLKVNFN